MMAAVSRASRLAPDRKPTMSTQDTRAYWRGIVAGSSRGYTPEALDEVVEIALSLPAEWRNAWHALHVYHERREHLLPRCRFCGSSGGRLDSAKPQHELCRVRAERGVPTPPLPSDRECASGHCRREQAVAS